MGVRKSVELRSRFGCRVRALLTEKGFSTADLAEGSALPIGRVERILNGALNRITLSDMAAIASVLQIPLSDLLAPAGHTVPLVALEIVEEGGAGDP